MSQATLTILRDNAPLPAGLIWENPPERTQTSGKHAHIAAALRERPNTWAVIRAYPHTQKQRAWGFAGCIRDGKLIDLSSTVLADASNPSRKQVRVYVRYQPKAG